jgi:ATP-dependent phosphofructokinase / diphosphate-dependent phosphofructokinase
MATKKMNAFYAQSGGVTSVINASACGVIETARLHKDKIGKVYAGRNGIIGALTEDLIDTSKESASSIAALRQTPSGAFGSCRFKLKSLEANKVEYERLIEVFKAHNIGYFFYNGGGDSADTCYKVSQLSKAMNYPLQAIHVPKTVDNDLPITDCCPGFGSVAKYVAVSALEASFDVRSMCKTSTKVFVLEVMGRHAGWIAAAGGLIEDHGIPVVILFPEIVSTNWSKNTATAPSSCPKAATTPTARFWPNKAAKTPSATPSSAVRHPWSPTWSKTLWATNSTGR